VVGGGPLVVAVLLVVGALPPEVSWLTRRYSRAVMVWMEIVVTPRTLLA
jgi:hypothetical protein